MICVRLSSLHIFWNVLQSLIPCVVDPPCSGHVWLCSAMIFLIVDCGLVELDIVCFMFLSRSVNGDGDCCCALFCICDC